MGIDSKILHFSGAASVCLQELRPHEAATGDQAGLSSCPVTYTAAVQRVFVLFIAILSVSLVGAQCEYAASVNNGLVAEEGSDRETIEGGSNGGLIVVVRDGEVDGGLVLTTGAVVSAAVATSLLDPRFEDSGALEDAPSERTAFALGAAATDAASEGDGMPAPALRSGDAAGPVPEPSGILLFSVGLGVSAIVTRRLTMVSIGSSKRATDATEDLGEGPT